jgi:hypothetical protein
LPIARLWLLIPDNGFLPALHALLYYDQGEFADCERVSRESGQNQWGMPGYEAIARALPPAISWAYLMQEPLPRLG